MVVVVFFGRTFSFQPKNKTLRNHKPAAAPCPVLAQLAAEASALRQWQAESDPQSGSHSWLCSGMARLAALHSSLDKLLRLPHALPPADRLLDDLLLLADAHASFRLALIDLTHHHSAARAALRRRHPVHLAASVRDLRKTEKDLFKLSSDPYCAAHPSSRGSSQTHAHATLAREAAAVAASAAAAIFLGVAAASATASAIAFCSSPAAPTSWMARPVLRRLSSASSAAAKAGNGRGGEEEKAAAWRRSAVARLEGMEECVRSLESGNERVLKLLLDDRVHLLNIITTTNV